MWNRNSSREYLQLSKPNEEPIKYDEEVGNEYDNLHLSKK